MDCADIKVEMSEGDLLDPLVIVEEGDEIPGVASEGSPAVEEDLDGGGEATVGEEVAGQKEKPEGRGSVSDGQNGGGEGEAEGKTAAGDVNTGGTEAVKLERSESCERQPEGTKSQEKDPKKAHRLTPDFPDALYELLCTLQEGRRINDQRCSFSLDTAAAAAVRRRRCHSEPNTTKPANRVVFSSMTSLQTEEFFELVATAQARRLDDQRALLSSLPKSRTRSLRGSIKQLTFVRRPAPAPAPDPKPAPAPKEDLYNMILTTQAQGRLEDQRSRAPGPMDDEDFFSLLLKVQGGRMEEQRTELPCMLQT